MRCIRALTAVLLLASNFCSAALAPSKWHFYPTTLRFKSAPCDMDTGPDGQSVWFLDIVGDRIGVVNVTTGDVKTFEVKWGCCTGGQLAEADGVVAQSCVVRTGKDGFVYFTTVLRNVFLRIDPVTYEITHFPVPQGPVVLRTYADAWAAKDGLWITQTDADLVIFWDYEAERATKIFLYPDDPFAAPSGPLGIRTDNAGNVYYSQFYSNQTAEQPPKKNSNITVYPPAVEGALPGNARAFTDNRYIWFNAFGAGGLIRHDIKTGQQRFISIPLSNAKSWYPVQNDADSQGRVWLSSTVQNSLAYYDPKTDVWGFLAIPGTIPASTGTFTLPVHFGPLNAIWTSRYDKKTIGYYLLD